MTRDLILAVRFTGETLVHGEDGTIEGVVVTVAGRDPGWVALAYRTGLVVIEAAQRVWRSVGAARRA